MMLWKNNIFVISFSLHIKNNIFKKYVQFCNFLVVSSVSRGHVPRAQLSGGTKLGEKKK